MKRTAQAALALLIFTALFSCHNLVVKLMPPEGDKITSFILANEVALISDNTITVTVPPSTDISALVPLIQVQAGATVIPITYEYITQAFPHAKVERLVSDWLSTNNKTDWALKVLKENPTFTVPELTTPINFTMPTLLAVISGQGNSRLYTVTVSGGKVMLPLPTEKNMILSFNVDGQIGQSIIDHGSAKTGSGSVTFTVPQSVNLRSLIPTVTASENAFVLPLTFNYLLRSFINADLFDLFMGYYLASDKSAYLQKKIQNLEGFVMPSKTLDLPIDFSATVPFAVVAWDYSISLYEIKATRVNTVAQLTDFILSKALNPELVRDAQGTINEAKKTVSITAWLPAEYTPAKQYIPTFTLAGQSGSANLSVDSSRIENNVTAIDCTSPKTLSVSRTINGVTTTTDYALSIDYKVDPDTVRSITDLRFTKKNNPSLLVNCITSIHDAKDTGTIKVSIPHTGAQPPRLVVDYISGGVVTDEFMQGIQSGTQTDTPHTRTLVCTSRDGTLQRRYTLLIDYIAVEGTGLPELQSFSFSALINKDLSKAVTARIDQTNNVIFAEIPYTSASYPRILIPEFSASGTVSVTSAPQISGISEQDFSRLVTYTVTSFWDPSETKQYSVQLAYSKAVVQNNHVLFYANGGSVTPEYVSVQKGSSVNSLPTPERVNFTFAGWYTQITGGQKINAPYTPQTDTTLYAQWEGTSYTVSFNANGGTGTMSPQTFTSGVAQNLSANTFINTGNYFVGWNTAQDGSGTYYADKAIPTASSGNVELYAQWSNSPGYTITFWANYTGSTETQNQSAQVNTSVLLQENRFIRQGYTFKEWNTTADGKGGTSYTDKAAYLLGSANTDLFAQWTANTHTLTFNANGTEISGTMANQTFTYDEAKNLSANAFTKTGYSFKEWSTQPNGGGDTFTDGQSYTIKDAPVTLYAQWTANTYTVIFDANGTETSGTMVNQTFTYDTTKNLSPNAFKKVGHYFTGWTTTANGTGGAYADGALYETPATNITLYAQWKIKDIIYVKSNAAGRNDGSSWTNAYTTLEAALEERRNVPYYITEENMYIGPVYVSIYIAATADGYTPAIEGTSFTLEHNTKFYGGFSGTEVELKDRPAGAKTALKGNGDRVLTGQNGLFVTIDGFAVSGGKTALQGGGIYIGTWGSRNRIAITNCDFTNNSAAGSHGGAVYAANIDITGCTFSENKVEGPTVETYTSDYSAYDMGGGALYIVNGTVTDCSFSKNKAISTDPEGHSFNPTARGGVGGAVYAYNTTLTNCVFTENEANLVEPTTAAESINRGAENTGRGGAVYANKSTVTESVFEKNTVGRSGTIYFGKNSEDKGGGGGIFADNDSTISSCTFTQNMSKNGSIEALFTGGGALYTNESTVTDCRFSYNTATANGGGIFTDNWTSSKNNTINNCTFENNTAGGYGGGISGLGLTLTNSIFKNNSAQKGTAYGATTNYSQYLAHFTVAFSGNTFHTNTAPSSSVFYFETFSTAGGSGVRTFKITGLNPQTNKDGSETLLPAVVYTPNNTYNANGFYITGEGITVE